MSNVPIERREWRILLGGSPHIRAELVALSDGDEDDDGTGDA